jgi:hypothetical protein
MQCVVVNAEGLLYGGFGEGKPHWFKTKREECVFDESIADQVVRQLKGLGFEDVAKRDANEVARKWVPKSLSAIA